MLEKDEAVVGVAAERYWSATEARVVVQAWRRSGERLSAFARRYGLKPWRVSRWAKRLEASPVEDVPFHPVRVVEDRDRRTGGEPIEIALDEGRSVRVPPGFAAEDLERVLRVLSC